MNETRPCRNRSVRWRWFGLWLTAAVAAAGVYWLFERMDRLPDLLEAILMGAFSGLLLIWMA